MSFSLEDVGSAAFDAALDNYLTRSDDCGEPDMTDEEYCDLMQATQEAPSGAEVDEMFRWWEKRAGVV
jgi:hypothetical protein